MLLAMASSHLNILNLFGCGPDHSSTRSSHLACLHFHRGSPLHRRAPGGTFAHLKKKNVLTILRPVTPLHHENRTWLHSDHGKHQWAPCDCRGTLREESRHVRIGNSEKHIKCTRHSSGECYQKEATTGSSTHVFPSTLPQLPVQEEETLAGFRTLRCLSNSWLESRDHPISFYCAAHVNSLPLSCSYLFSS